MNTDIPATPAQTAESDRFGGIALEIAAGATGLLAAATAIGVGHLVAVLLIPSASPILAVGSTVIDLTPESLKSFAIATFGQNDKSALLGGIVATLAVLAVGIGLVSLRHPRIGIAAISLFGVVGAGAALLRPAAVPVSVIPAVVGAVAGIAALVILRRALVAPDRAADARATEPDTPSSSRRRFLGSAAGVALLAFGSGGLGVLISARRAAIAAGGSSMIIPTPVDPAHPVPDGTDLGLPDLTPFVTANGDFYRVDTALDIPVIAAADWRLRIHGMVDHEVELTLDQLLELPTIERDITLTCVSNEVGGVYAGTARWIGDPLKTVLDEAGVQTGADQIVSRSIDGMTIGTPTAVALDGRDAMLAVAMNGQPLPPVHGYPVRMVVPGLYGYVSATKWLVDLELTTFDAFDPYWVQRGWAKQGPIKTMSRIDTPRPLSRVAAGKVAIAGVAWAQHRGIDKVEVRVDGGAWRSARLAVVDTIDTWRQWTYAWDADPGNHTLDVRATDGTGATQPEARVTPFPDGATGWHSIVMSVT